jgi:hypothetical protein
VERTLLSAALDFDFDSDVDFDFDREGHEFHSCRIVWSGHSCPLPLTLILILTLILTLTGKGTSSTRAASALPVWSGHSCPLPLILNLISQMHAQPLPGRARAALQQPALSEAERAV